MRRTPAAEDQSDSPTALIARISAGRDTGYDAECAIPVQRGVDGRHRRPGAGSATPTASVAPAELPTRTVSAAADVDAIDFDAVDLDAVEFGTDIADAPESSTRTMVRPTRRGRRAAANRATVRRLAPLGVGAAVMLVAAVVVAVIPQNDPATAGPELSSQLAAGTDTAVPDGSVDNPAYPVSPDPDAADLDAADASPSATAGSTSPTVSATRVAATRALPLVTTEPPAASTPRPAPAGDGTQAATRLGWQLEASDEFNGTGLSDSWGAYDGAGQDGKGRRTPAAISVSGGIMTIKGDSHGTTGGMAWNDNQTYGRWEIRARFPKGDDQYHPVLLLWPDNGWPPEVDFSETTSASSDTSFYLHYSSKNEQVSASRSLDLTQWHDYAVEWESGRVTGFIDGVQWFQSTNGKTIPDVPMHLAIQLDYFPDGGSPRPSELDVDYVRIYK